MRPRLVVPIHWGTFAPIGASTRRVDRSSDPAWAFVARVAERAPSVAVRVLALGESVALADA
jgi:L-ascorbate metabolism protein UlaG (beta-lactamase superfamily)